MEQETEEKSGKSQSKPVGKISPLMFVPVYLTQRFKRLISGTPQYEEEDVNGKVALVTGANSGIGKETALALAQKGCKVIMGCRNMELGEKALKEIKEATKDDNTVLKRLDLANFDSVRKFAEEVKKEYPAINIFIGNAGVFLNEGESNRDSDGDDKNMKINHLGHFLLVNLLLDNIKAATPSRIVMVSSTNQLVSDLDLDDLMLKKATSFAPMGTRPYNNSKYANSLFIKELSKRLEGSGVTTYSLCPGLVKSNLFRDVNTFQKVATNINMAFVGLSPKQGSETILYCALAKECAKETGKVYRFCQPFEAATKRLDDNVAARLWEVSEKMVNSRTAQA